MSGYTSISSDSSYHFTQVLRNDSTRELLILRSTGLAGCITPKNGRLLGFAMLTTLSLEFLNSYDITHECSILILTAIMEMA